MTTTTAAPATAVPAPAMAPYSGPMEIDGQADDQGHTQSDMASAMDRILTLLMASRPDLDFEDGDVLTIHIAVCEHLRAHSFEASRTPSAAPSAPAPPTGRPSAPAPTTATYIGPLWNSTRSGFCGRDDASGEVMCQCPTYERTTTCCHVESVKKHNRPDALVTVSPDSGEDETQVMFGGTYDLTDWPGPGLGVMPRRVGGCTVTLRRVA